MSLSSVFSNTNVVERLLYYLSILNGRSLEVAYYIWGLAFPLRLVLRLDLFIWGYAQPLWIGIGSGKL